MDASAPATCEWRVIASSRCFYGCDAADLELRCGSDSARTKTSAVCRGHVEAFRRAFEGGLSLMVEWRPAEPGDGWRNAALDPVPGADADDVRAEALVATMVAAAYRASRGSRERETTLRDLSVLCAWSVSARSAALNKLRAIDKSTNPRAVDFERELNAAVSR